MDKLSQAIRLGATFRPRGEGQLYCHETNSTCALGAAIEAVGLEEWSHYSDSSKAYRLLHERFPELATKDEHLPGVHSTLNKAIVLLNDSKCWSREDIADWLEAKGL